MTTTKFLRSPAPLAASLLMAGLPLGSFAQTPAAASGSGATSTVWQQCTALSDGPARLACFDQWAQQQSQQPLVSQQAQPAATTPPASANAMQGLTPPASALATADLPAPIGGCRNDGYTEMSRFWELEAGTDCGTFSFRGYRPLSVSFAVGDKVNRQPSSLNPVNSATTETDYQKQEMRIQLSVRTKLAQNLLTDPNGKLR
ncbi:MAG: phospholipase A, partial [Comamonas sp.]|nr:phospholipase A [Comamonas sp.]